MEEEDMKTIGVTGGIGTGKSTVCDLLAARGAFVVKADELARQVMNDDEQLRTALVDAFGDRVYRDDGALDRPWLAAQVFGHEGKLKHLNALVHPRVRNELFRLRDQAAREGCQLVVYEAALIFESGAHRFLDAVVAVEAPLEARLERVMARDGVTRADVERRIQHQLSPNELRDRADYVILNDGDHLALETQVEAMLAALVPEYAAAAPPADSL